MAVPANATHDSFTEAEIPVVTGASVEELLRDHGPQTHTHEAPAAAFTAAATPPTEQPPPHVLQTVAFEHVPAPATVMGTLPAETHAPEHNSSVGALATQPLPPPPPQPLQPPPPQPPAATFASALATNDIPDGSPAINDHGVASSTNPFNFLCMAATDRLAKEDVQQSPFAIAGPLPPPPAQPLPPPPAQPPKKKRGPKKGRPMAARRPHVANPKRRYVAGLQDTGSKRDLQWNIMFMRLQDYKFEKGDTNVPQGYKEDPELATWVKNQRQAYRFMLERKTTKRISPERVTRLNHIGFEWRKYNKSQEDPLVATTAMRTKARPIQQAFTIPLHPPPAQYYAPQAPPDPHHQQQQPLVHLAPGSVTADTTVISVPTATLPPAGVVPANGQPQPTPAPAPIGIPTIIHHLHHPVTVPAPQAVPAAPQPPTAAEAHLLCTESV